MSSTSIPPSTATTASPSSSSSSGLDNPSTLLFVFLISVLSLFSAFLTCGIIWHRLVARRRRINAPLQAGPPLVIETLEKPKMWDVRILPTHDIPQWIDTKPLAGDTRHETDAQSDRVRPTWRQCLTGYIPREIRHLFHHPSVPQSRSPTPHTTQVEWLQNGTDIRVSVFIQMPYSSLHTDEDCSDHIGLHEVVIATTDLSYHTPDSS
ncbi:hypothetical protein V8B97DRAFT_984889 [Scleroderma yunnanense]